MASFMEMKNRLACSSYVEGAKKSLFSDEDPIEDDCKSS